MIQIPRTKIWEACGDDPARESLQHPMFYPGKQIDARGNIYDSPSYGTLLAADGYVAVTLDVRHDPEDLGGHIPTEALKAAVKYYKNDVLYIDASNPEHVVIGDYSHRQMFARPKDLIMMNLEGIARVIAQRHEHNLHASKLPPQFVSVRLNLQYVSRVQEALTRYCSATRRDPALYEVVIRVDQENAHEPVLILPHSGETYGFAVQMPLRKTG